MTLLSFPPSPVNGELYPVIPAVGQNQYQWDSATSTWSLLGTTTAVTPGTYGNATNIGQFTVNGQGQVTSASNIPISFAKVVTAPLTSASAGSLGEVAVGTGFFYFYDGTQWLRVAGSTF